MTIFGAAIWDPVQLAGKLGSPVTVAIALAGVVVATLTTNVAANIVSPANAFSNAWPRGISFRTGGLITGALGIVMMPWRLLENADHYLSWLVAYSGFLGPIAGILICDYFLLRRKIVLVEDLYKRNGFYEFSSGFNWNGIAALGLGCGVAFAGLVIEPLRFLYNYAWFVGFLVGFVVYYVLMRSEERRVGKECRL